MKRESTGPVLSAVFVDYDNIYLSLKRKSEEAAKRFAKDSAVWIKEVESGRLITPTNVPFANTPRRIVMNRCYGNPVPRRNATDNSTDMSSFPFVRHHFLRAGFEVVDCPPLTQQLKNSADIRMVMDVRDLLTHETYFEEFIILSGDADFTPLLHRLRAHARRTVIFANDFTAAPYTAISDGEIRESGLLTLLLEGKIAGPSEAAKPAQIASSAEIDIVRKEIIGEVVAGVRASGMPLPLEVLADRAMRALGHDKTVGTGWAGAGSFRDLLLQALPEDIRLTDQPPYLAFEARRQAAIAQPAPQVPVQPADVPRGAPLPPQQPAVALRAESVPAPAQSIQAAPPPALAQQPAPQPVARRAQEPLPSIPAQQPAARPPQPPQQQIRTAEGASALQQSIARIHDACQAPPLSPPEYRALFDTIALEINEAGLQGAQTITSITNKAQAMGLDIRRDDVRFVLEVVSEADPWFEQGASAGLFAGRFRNFVVARCRSQGLNLTSEELDLIDAWFAGNPAPPQQARIAPPGQAPAATTAVAHQAPPAMPAQAPRAAGGERWWNVEDTRAPADPRQAAGAVAARPPAPSLGDFQPGSDLNTAEDFPRIVKNRLRS
jgi:hypothetical protein